MEGITTFIEVMLTKNLKPFRRDAMKNPVEVAGIDPKDTVIQQLISGSLISNNWLTNFSSWSEIDQRVS